MTTFFSAMKATVSHYKENRLSQISICITHLTCFDHAHLHISFHRFAMPVKCNNQYSLCLYFDVLIEGNTSPDLS